MRLIHFWLVQDILATPEYHDDYSTLESWANCHEFDKYWGLLAIMWRHNNCWSYIMTGLCDYDSRVDCRATSHGSLVNLVANKMYFGSKLIRCAEYMWRVCMTTILAWKLLHNVDQATRGRREIWIGQVHSIQFDMSPTISRTLKFSKSARSYATSKRFHTAWTLACYSLRFATADWWD